MFEDALKPFHLQPLWLILRKRIFWKNIFPNMMKERKDFSRKNGVKFPFNSRLVVNASVVGSCVHFWH